MVDGSEAEFGLLPESADQFRAALHRLQSSAGEIARLAQIRRAQNRPGFPGDSISWEVGVMNTTKRYSPEVRERAIRLVFEHHADEYKWWTEPGRVEKLPEARGALNNPSDGQLSDDPLISLPAVARDQFHQAGGLGDPGRPLHHAVRHHARLRRKGWERLLWAVP